MSEQQELARGASHLDDALEHLTFDRFDWALESLWRGVHAMLLATGARLAPLPPAGRLPAPDTLGEPRDACPELTDLVQGLLRARHASDAATPATQHGAIEALAFAASDHLLLLARQRRLIDPGTVYGSLSGAWAPPDVYAHRGAHRIHRRALLGLISAGAASALGACRSEAATPGDRTATPSASPQASTTRAVPEALPPATVRAQTSIEGMQWPTADPFLFCAYHVDHYPAGDGAMGPSASLAGRNLGRDFDPTADWRMYHGQRVPGFPRHPHRGFETVTFVRRGLLDHADSMGAAARYGDGDVQWLTAGDGIQHAEMFPLLRADADNPFELFQIWLNLPASHKRTAPHFTMLWSEDVPRVTVYDEEGRAVELTLAAGAYGEHAPPSPPPASWASQPDSDVAIWNLKLAPGARFTLPPVAEGTERSLYLHQGEGGRVAGVDVAHRTRVELAGRGTADLEAGAAELEVLLLQGRPIGEPVSRRGPFVMNTPDEIREAYDDYRRTGFGGWPWDADGPVHEVTRGRFALRPDGALEEPS